MSKGSPHLQRDAQKEKWFDPVGGASPGSNSLLKMDRIPELGAA